LISTQEKVPLILKKELYWFAEIIGRPIDEDSRMNPISPTGNPMELESADHIAPSPTLRPAQRIQIYNQQYWWRLLTILHDTFPLLTRLFGYYDFNRLLGIPYIVKYRPNHWSLNFLGSRMAQWIEEEYHNSDKLLVLDAARIDAAFSDSFVSLQMPAVQLVMAPSDLQQGLNLKENETLFEELLKKPLYLQSHIYLFNLDYHLFNYRNVFLLQPPEYWIDNEFPKLEKERAYFFVLYRNLKNEISWKETSKIEFELLNLFKDGYSIEKACEWLENQESEVYELAMNHLQSWFQEWTLRKWLTDDCRKS